MFGLGKHGPDARYGAIVDVGSGSVGVAIVVSTPDMEHPGIIWSHRERMILRDIGTADDSAKHITTALLNTMLALGSDGNKTLTEYDKGADISTIQIAVSAPWSYTVTKTVSYSHEEPFQVTEKLIDELVTTAQKQALEAIDANDIIKKLGLEVMTRATISISANNYMTTDVYGQEANSISISHVSAISQKRLLDALREGKDKVLPKATIERYSFMLVFYCVLRKLAPDTSEVCLIDVSSEATEIGIVREGVLKYATHASLGTFTIAREISSLCDIPKEEALAYVRGNTALENTLSIKKRADLDAVISSYEDKISELFMRTGDSLAIPRPLFIHTDSRTEKFFSDRIKKAATKATKSEHSVHLVTSKLISEKSIDDTALLLSADFFHKMHGCEDFEQV